MTLCCGEENKRRSGVEQLLWLAAIWFWWNLNHPPADSVRPDPSPQGKRKIMASICLFSSKTLVLPSATYLPISSSSTSHSCCFGGCRCSFPIKPISTSNLIIGTRRTGRQVVRMAPEEEKLTRRNPLDFPIVSFSLFPSFIFRPYLMFFAL